MKFSIIFNGYYLYKNINRISPDRTKKLEWFYEKEVGMHGLRNNILELVNGDKKM